MAEHKGLHVQLLMLDDVDVSANDHLITVLIRNLIRNALTHTPAGGTITIRLVSRSLQIENTQSLGLGLAIVKSIGDTYEFTPRITQAENRFIFSIQF